MKATITNLCSQIVKQDSEKFTLICCLILLNTPIQPHTHTHTHTHRYKHAEKEVSKKEGKQEETHYLTFNKASLASSSFPCLKFRE